LLPVMPLGRLQHMRGNKRNQPRSLRAMGSAACVLQGPRRLRGVAGHSFCGHSFGSSYPQKFRGDYCGLAISIAKKKVLRIRICGTASCPKMLKTNHICVDSGATRLNELRETSECLFTGTGVNL